MSAEVRTSPKNARKPQRRSLALREAIATIAAEYDRLSVRQLFYQDVLTQLVDASIRAAIDVAAWERVAQVEVLEAATLESLALAGWVPGQRYAAPEEAA